MEAFYLEAALHLGPHEEKDVLFCFDKKCSEDSMVSRHPCFTDLEIKVVGEVGDEHDRHHGHYQKRTGGLVAGAQIGDCSSGGDRL